jgi:hypothetical protein
MCLRLRSARNADPYRATQPSGPPVICKKGGGRHSGLLEGKVTSSPSFRAGPEQAPLRLIKQACGPRSPDQSERFLSSIGFKSTPSAPMTFNRCLENRSRSRNIVLQPRHS